MKYCCICLDKTEEVTKLDMFKNAFVCQDCKVNHFEIIESGAEITKYYGFIKDIQNNLESIKKLQKK